MTALQQLSREAVLSRDLALALGYFPESVREVEARPIATWIEVYGQWPRFPGWPLPVRAEWREFRYDDPTVAMPLLEMLMREHKAQPWQGVKQVAIWIPKETDYWADTLPEAIARAVIALSKGTES